jgi:hypothetical protein
MIKILVCLFSACTCMVHGDTLLPLGEKAAFGSDAQIEHLKKAI